MFDPNSFLDMQIDGANSIKKLLCPVGEYQAIIEKVDCRTWTKKDDPSVSGLALDILWSIEDQNVKSELDKDKVTVKQGLMLDLTDSGGLDMGKGKNVALGRLREATGLNVPGQPFSPSMFTGRMAKVSVSHRINGEDLFDEIKAVTKL